MRFLVFIWVHLTFLLFTPHVRAAFPYTAVRFDHLSVQHGLSQSSVISIWQDRYGLMWLGTRDGLNLYDGYHFKTFRNRQGDSSSIASNVINHISEDSRGNIWLATEKGLSCYDHDRQVFSSFQIDPHEPEIRYVLADSKDRVWVASHQGVFSFDVQEQAFRQADFSMQGADRYTDHSATVLYESKDGSLWVGTAHRGLVGFHEHKNKITHMDSLSPDLKLSDLRIEALTEDLQGNIWVGTKEGGLFCINPSSTEWQHFSTRNPDEHRQLSHDNARALACDHEGNIWIGTFDGLDKYDAEREQMIHFSYEEGDINGLSHGSVKSLYVDRKGSVWIGTYFGGVNIYDQDNQRFSHYYHIPGDEHSLSFNVVGAFTETADQHLIVGTERGGLNLIDPQSGAHRLFVHHPRQPQSLAGNTIKSLFTDRQGRIWVGLFQNGLNRFFPETGKVIRYPLPSDPQYRSLRHRIVNSIVEDQRGHLWLALDGKECLRKFDPEQERFINFEKQKELYQRLGDVSLKHICQDRLGNLWLATRGNGLLLFNESQGVIAHFHTKSKQFYLPQNEISSVFEDSQGQIWVATIGSGLLRFEAASKTFLAITTAEGLANNTVYGLQEDAQGLLWCFTLSGLSRIEPSDLSITNYTFASGFPLEELNEGAFYLNHAGEMLVGGSNGYVIFDPSMIRANQYVPPVRLTRLTVSNREILPGDESGILEQSLMESSSITLDYFHNMLSLEFASLSYLHPENNQYAYMLEGFDEDWIDNGASRRATYTNLQEGEYLFKVKGSNNDGLWNEEAAVLAITVLPPPWKTWWAYLVYAVLIISGFLLIRYNALKGAQLKHDLRLQQLEKEKWKEIHRLKLEYFTEVSHEFRTPLTLIAGPLEKLIESREGSPTLRRQLKIMFYNCRRLLLLIDQILELRRIESRHSELDLAPHSLQQIITQVVDSFKSLADQLNIRLELQADLPEQLSMLDQDKLEKILFNLLYNAFKFTESGGRIIVKATQPKEWDMAVISVTDSGTGIAEADLEKIFDRFYRGKSTRPGTGIGLSMVKSLLELWGGSISVSSKEGEGSCFTIHLPLTSVEPEPIRPDQEHHFIKPLPLEYEAEWRNESSESAEDPTEGKELILIVEDHAELREYLREHLSAKYETAVAKNGAKALAKARKLGPSLIISDIMMPEMDGTELLKKVREDIKLSHIPFIMLTAKSGDQERLRGLESGADAYLTKPFILKELDQRIHNILSNRRRLHQYFSRELQLPEGSHALSSYDEKLLRNIETVVEQQLSEPTLSVEFLGKEVGLSRVHLYRKMKALAGMAPTDYIKNYRLKKAAVLLSSQKYKVAEVAYHVGFQDVNYFSKCFKKTYHMSPTDWIEKCKQDPVQSG